jgi:hypothetical protein
MTGHCSLHSFTTLKSLLNTQPFLHPQKTANGNIYLLFDELPSAGGSNKPSIA